MNLIKRNLTILLIVFLGSCASDNVNPEEVIVDNQNIELTKEPKWYRVDYSEQGGYLISISLESHSGAFEIVNLLTEESIMVGDSILTDGYSIFASKIQ